MRKIPEEILQNVWPHVHRFCVSLTASGGQAVEVISPGVANRDAGPDFLNATLRIDGMTWCGDVEIHVRSSDWQRHNHHLDSAYDAVVLHVVAYDDGAAWTSQGHQPVTLVLPHLDSLLDRYYELAESATVPRCGGLIGDLESIRLEAWLTRVLVERLEEKSHAILADVSSCELGWEESFYRSVARSLGLRVNADAMHHLSQSVPLKVLYKSRDSLATLEAILLGQSGLLPEDDMPEDVYVAALRREYAYQAKKHHLSPIKSSEWRFMRIRPSAFPTIRISQLAGLLHQSDYLFSRALEAVSMEALRELFSVKASCYWESHHLPFRSSRSASPKCVGAATVLTIILNSVIPYRFAYALEQGDEALQEQTLSFLERISPEDNSVVRAFARAGVEMRSAIETQAVIQLNRKYCTPRLCYRCPAGFRFLTAMQGG